MKKKFYVFWAILLTISMAAGSVPFNTMYALEGTSFDTSEADAESSAEKTPDAKPAPLQLERIVLDTHEITVRPDGQPETVGWTLTVEKNREILQILPGEETEVTVSWTCSDADVLSLSEEGAFTALAPGTAELTVTAAYEGQSVSDTATVFVEEIPAGSLELEETNLILGLQQSRTLGVSVLPEQAAMPALIFSSSDESIVSVSEEGLLTGCGIGTAAVTVQSEDGALSASCTVTVRFTDVLDEADYYFTPVYWAYGKGITKGYEDGSFGVGMSCSRADMVTFLWRLCGKPEPLTTKNPFTDIAPTDYFYKAVLWANENRIAKGYDDQTFRSSETCLREHAAMFLYRLAGAPAVQKTESFTDTGFGAYYDQAVLWASEKGIAKGYADGTFRPSEPCLREQILTFLYRYAAQKLPLTPVPGTPVLVSAMGKDKSVTVKWKASANADGYRVYRKPVGATGWKLLATVTGLSYTDQTPDYATPYLYTVRAVRNIGDSQVLSGYDANGVGVTLNIPKPAVTSATPKDKSITVKWKSVPGAAGYRVYRKLPTDTGWKVLAIVTGLSYTDTTIQYETNYTYTVRAYAVVGGEKVWSGYEAGKSAKASIPKPSVTSAAAKDKSITVKWKSVPGAAGYRVYRKLPADTGWKALALVTGLSYTDTTIRYETDYIYTVRAYAMAGDKEVWSGYEAGKSAKAAIPKPSVTSAQTSGKSIVVKWNGVTGVSGYGVYRRVPGGSWVLLDTVSGSQTSYTDESGSLGATYEYAVKCYEEQGGRKVWSGSGATKSCILHPKAPQLVSAIPAGPSHMQITWNPIDGADGYQIFIKTSDGWKHAGTADSGATNTFTVDSLDYGRTYTFTVRAYWGKSNKTGGAYDSAGITARLSYRSRYVNGYKLYYDDNGNLIKNVDKIIGRQSSYVVKVNKQMCVTTIYAPDGNRGYIIPVKSCVCSPGEPTPTGTFYTPEKYRWKLLIGPVYGQWSTRIYGGILFHTVYYYTDGDNTSLCVTAFNKLGSLDSMGCVRLLCEDAKWIYDNCSLGMQVTIYNSSDPGPFGKPSIGRLPSWHTWDPTDPNCRYLCERYNCH